MAVTVQDVAAAAGVSRATAARVLGGYGNVGGETADRVQRAADQLGYVPNTIARALASGVSGAIGVILGDVGNPFFGAIVRSMGAHLQEHGYTLLLSNSQGDVAQEAIALQALRARRVDGLIVVANARRPTPALRDAARGPAPLVLLDRAVRGLGVDVVTVDNIAASRNAVDHLLDHGHRRVGIVAGDIELQPTLDRIEGYRRALTKRGIAIDDRLIAVAGANRDEAFAATTALLAGPDAPTALLAGDNHMALGAMLAIRQAGLSIPAELSLIGIDDIEWTSFVDPPMTVVALPSHELGVTTGQRLLDRMAGDGGPPSRQLLDTTLVVRGSVGAPPARSGRARRR